jgi:hypothetical protein
MKELAKLKSGSANDITRIRVTGKSEYDKWWTLVRENSPKVWYDIFVLVAVWLM